jgi:hypothetical protein
MCSPGDAFRNHTRPKRCSICALVLGAFNSQLNLLESLTN